MPCSSPFLLLPTPLCSWCSPSSFFLYVFLHHLCFAGHHVGAFLFNKRRRSGEEPWDRDEWSGRASNGEMIFLWRKVIREKGDGLLRGVRVKDKKMSGNSKWWGKMFFFFNCMGEGKGECVIVREWWDECFFFISTHTTFSAYSFFYFLFPFFCVFCGFGLVGPNLLFCCFCFFFIWNNSNNNSKMKR